MKRTVASRAIGQGLAKVEPSSPNMLIAYSAKAGSTAADGDGNNSPFTVALSKHLTTPGLDVRRAFGFVRDDVLKTTNNRQEPFVYGSLGGDDVPLVPAPKVAPPVAAASPQADMRRDYELALQIGNKSALNAFLAQYPDGFYASLAKLQIEKLSTEEARVAATEKARVAEQERARLAAEGAQKATQARAEADAKSAEQARIAAEKAKEVAQQQAAAAEARRAETEKAAADAGTKVATITLTPAVEKPNLAALSTGAPQADVTKSVQSELRRVGCLSGDRRRQLEHHVAALADPVQSLRQDQVRHQACLDRCARCDQDQDVARVSGGLRAWLQGRRRQLREDHLRRRLVPQR